MKIILLKNVENLGRQGEVKEVAVGFARNFLIPRGLADIATPELISHIEKIKKHELKKAEKELVQTEKIASEIDGLQIEIKAKSSEGGTLYAAITSEKIAAELNKKGYKIKKEQIATDPIKDLGDHEVVVNLAHGLESKINLTITPLENDK